MWARTSGPGSHCVVIILPYTISGFQYSSCHYIRQYTRLAPGVAGQAGHLALEALACIYAQVQLPDHLRYAVRACDAPACAFATHVIHHLHVASNI